MESDVDISSVEETQTRNGNSRFVVRDASGTEYTTFRPNIGKEALKFEGRRARVTFHEEEKNGFHNVYLDAIAAAPDDAGQAQAGQSHDPDEVAWNTAVEAAPWLVGSSEPDEPVDPDELYEKLEPFKRRVAEDIRDDDAPPDA